MLIFSFRYLSQIYLAFILFEFIIMRDLILFVSFEYVRQKILLARCIAKFNMLLYELRIVSMID